MSSKFTLVVILLLFFSYILLGIVNLNLNSDPQAYDTTAYLGEANLIKNHGGITNFLNLCITGKFIQANQHPLYILLLTPFASTDISFFVTAKFISFILGFILIACLFIIGRKMYGNLVAAVAVFGVILNGVFLEWTTMVASEPLLMLFSLLYMFYIIEGFKKNNYWIYAGAFAGLAYLAKGTALLLIPGFILSVIIVYKFKILGNKFFYLFFLSFVLVASPLFIRNIVVYHDPLFNVNKYIAKYSFEQIYNSKYTVFNPEEGTNQWKFEKMNDLRDNNKLRTSSVDTLNSANLYKKILSGIGLHSGAFLYSLILYQRYFSGNIINLVQSNLLGKSFWLLSLLLFSLFIIGLSREDSLGTKIFIITSMVTFIIALTLFRPLTRYPLPLIPLIWIYIALGIVTVLNLFSKKYLLKYLKIDVISYFPHFLLVLIILNFGYLFSHNTLTNPIKSVKYNDSRLNLLNWLRTNLKRDDKYTMGPNFNWQLEKGTWILPPTSGREDISKIISFVKRHDIRYIIMERNHILSNGGAENKRLTGEYFEIDPIDGLVSKKNVDDWILVYKDKRKPVEFLVYAAR